MIPIISLVTSVKDYIEIAHKLIESDSNFSLTNYNEIGPIITYILLSIKDFFYDIISLNWLKNIWTDSAIIIPDISSSMISEISILDGYFHNMLNFLDTPISYGSTNGIVYNLEKFSIGLINSLFLWLPTSTAHIITLRRFIMQGLEAGYIAGLGTITGSILWIACIIFGCRFFVIPWISLDIFRYILGFILLVKYMWDSFNERRTVLEDLSKTKIFLLSFLLALTEQTSIFPFLTNLSIGPEASILESFPSENYWQFVSIHSSYIIGLVIGSLSLLHFTCWFLENPAFKIYMWVISSFKVSSSYYYKILNFTFLYLTMLCAISSIPYYGLDYTLTNPLGLVHDDKILEEKSMIETSFIHTKASDRNTRRNRGRHGRRERWKRRIRKYRTFDASLYEDGVYDLFTIEDLNYGFDKFWLRRKLRNHRIRFRFFPESVMRSFKRQLSKPRLETYSGPRQEFFRILFELAYHPSFHEYNKIKLSGFANKNTLSLSSSPINSVAMNKNNLVNKNLNSAGVQDNKQSFNSNADVLNQSKLIVGMVKQPNYSIKNNLIYENSMLRKFLRKVNLRIKTSEITLNMKKDIGVNSFNSIGDFQTKLNKSIYSKRWKEIFSKLNTASLRGNGNEKNTTNPQLRGFLKNFYKNGVMKTPTLTKINYENEDLTQDVFSFQNFNKKMNSKQNLSKKDKEILFYRSMLGSKNSDFLNSFNSKVFLHPIKFYLEKQKAFERKLRYYTPTVFRKFSVENNAPYFRTMLKRYFYYYKPNLRWEHTMKNGSLRKARRKRIRYQKKRMELDTDNNDLSVFSKLNNTQKKEQFFTQENGVPNAGKLVQSVDSTMDQNGSDIFIKTRIQKPTDNYSVIGKKSSRYRYQIYKDVLEHWFYSPFNRLLLKLDIDSFIKRQPNSHFLTQKEENLLHLRRFLLSEHYNTLRWYTYMQHYRSMKTKIGGTKSFASRSYNQQFHGTFKKIRHLFAITPSQTICNESINNVAAECKDPIILKFDQPLYNESFNNSNKTLQNNLIMHEELLTPPQPPRNTQKKGEGESKRNSIVGEDLLGPEDLLTQSTNIIGEYLEKSASIKVESIKDLIKSKNYSELTNFLYKGQKLRGSQPVLNDGRFISQEKNYLLTDKEKNDLNLMAKKRIQNFLRETNLQESLWVNLLKKWKTKIHDPEALKTFILQRGMDELDQKDPIPEKNLKKKLLKLDNWLKTKLDINQTKTNSGIPLKSEEVGTAAQNPSITNGVKKALIEGISNVEKLDLKTMNQKERSFWKVNKLNKESFSDTLPNFAAQSELKTENQILYSLNSLSNIVKNLNKKESSEQQKSLTQAVATTEKIFKINQNTAQLRHQLLRKTSLNKIKEISKNYKEKLSNFIGINRFLKFLKPINKKDLNYWKKRERALTSIKKSHKEFKKIFKIQEIKGKNDPRAKNARKALKNYFKDLIQKNRQTPSIRKKRDFSTNNFNLVATQEQQSNFSEAAKDSVSLRTIIRNYNQQSLENPKQPGYFLSNYVKKFFSNDLEINEDSMRRTHSPIEYDAYIIEQGNEYPTDQFKKLDKYKEKPGNETKKAKLLQEIYDRVADGNKAPYTIPGNNILDTPFSMEWQKKDDAYENAEDPWYDRRDRYTDKVIKYRKRRRQGLYKIRNLNRQLKIIKSKIEIQNWWWKQFLPSLQATTDSLWQIEKDRQIQEKLNEIANASSNFINSNSSCASCAKSDNTTNLLPIGNYDFKPLALSQSLVTQQEKNKVLNNDQFQKQGKDFIALPDSNLIDKISENLFAQPLILNPSQSLQINLPYFDKNKDSNQNMSVLTKKQNYLNVNSLPFYAGWDESLRKFIVTNRFLSRRDSGYQITKPSNLIMTESLGSKNNNNNDSLNGEGTEKLEDQNILFFNSAPLKGMNVATTLYWQIPFSTYNSDQFFALGIDGFSPINWRRFQFRHTLLKTWLYHSQNQLNKETKPIIIKKKLLRLTPTTPSNKVSSQINNTASQIHQNLFYKIKEKYYRSFKNVAEIQKINSKGQGQEVSTNQKMMARNVLKRYRRVRRHPRPPMSFPSGPLQNQVLPVHYIYIFYKRSRLPRNRYLKRKIGVSSQKNLKLNSAAASAAINKMNQQNNLNYQFPKKNINTLDFTLGKRLKTKRKYHRKLQSNRNSEVLPRRLKFVGENFESLRWRPVSIRRFGLNPVLAKNQSIEDFTKEQMNNLALKTNQSRSAKQNINQNRIKHLRRRVQNVIIRPIWRYRPKAGGFVWPGDYLRLESVKEPLLEIVNNKKDNKTDSTNEQNSMKSESLRNRSAKMKRNTKRILTEWQVQPKKYFVEKHNIKVIKKKLEKAQRSNKIKQKIKELSFIL